MTDGQRSGSEHERLGVLFLQACDLSVEDRGRFLDRAWHHGVALAVHPSEQGFAVATPTSSVDVIDIATARAVGTLDGHTD